MTNSISIVKGTDSVVALIGSIGTKQGDYRNVVSSAVLSAVAHSLEHGETSTVAKLLNEMFSIAYRDLKVVASFISSVTPIILEETKEGRRTRFSVKACQFISGDYDKEGKTAKEIGELKVKALTRHNSRAVMFETFSTGGETKVRNVEWKAGDDKSTKTVGVKYNRDVFAWFEDVEYIRKEAAKAKDENAIDPFAVLVKDAYENIQSPITAAIKALEALKGEERTEQVVTDLTALQAIANRVIEHVNQRSVKRAEAVEIATLEKVGATKAQVTAWTKQRALRVSEGKEAANIETEFNAYVTKLKEKAAKAA